MSPLSRNTTIYLGCFLHLAADLEVDQKYGKAGWVDRFAVGIALDGGPRC